VGVSRGRRGGRSPRVTLVDVARLAEVNCSTVSRVFSGSRHVAPVTRARVLDAARALGYRPNAIARSLITCQTRIIGIVVTNITLPLHPQLLEQCVVELQAHGRQALVVSVPPGQVDGSVLDSLLQYQVDGLIVISTVLSAARLAECARAGMPVVALSKLNVDAPLISVGTDDLDAGRQVADLLLDTGHRRVAYMGWEPYTRLSQARGIGLAERLRERGADLALREHTSFTHDSGLAAAERLLDRDDPPDAIVCVTDLPAVGVLDCARVRGVRVPEELAIVGFNDLPFSRWPSINLTTVRIQSEAIVRAAVGHLLNRLESPRVEPVVELFPGEIVERGTTRPRGTSPQPSPRGRGRQCATDDGAAPGHEW